jgi:hypothetical protein
MPKRNTPATFMLPEYDPALFAAEENGAKLEVAYIRETEWRTAVLLTLIVVGVTTTMGSLILFGGLRPADLATTTLAPMIGVAWLTASLKRIVKDPVAAAKREIALGA